MPSFVSTAVKKQNCLVGVHVFTLLILFGNFHLTMKYLKDSAHWYRILLNSQWTLLRNCKATFTFECCNLHTLRRLSLFFFFFFEEISWAISHIRKSKAILMFLLWVFTTDLKQIFVTAWWSLLCTAHRERYLIYIFNVCVLKKSQLYVVHRI